MRAKKTEADRSLYTPNLKLHCSSTEHRKISLHKLQQRQTCLSSSLSANILCPRFSKPPAQTNSRGITKEILSTWKHVSLKGDDEKCILPRNQYSSVTLRKTSGTSQLRKLAKDLTSTLPHCQGRGKQV